MDLSQCFTFRCCAPKGNRFRSGTGSEYLWIYCHYSGLDPYPNLHQALTPFGVNWPVQLVTTHPPSAFLLVAPIAFLPWQVAFGLWGWLMIAAIILSLRAYHFSWQLSIILGLLSMLWPPTITSLGNITIVWILGLALAYRERDRSPF